MVVVILDFLLRVLGIHKRSKNVMDKILVNVTKLQVLLSRFELAS